MAAPKEAQSAVRVPGGSSSDHQEPRGPLRPGPLTPLPPPLLQDSAISPDSGRAGSPTSPSLPRPAQPGQRDRARPGPAQPLSTHGSDCSGGSSPAPASPPPTPGRNSAARSEPRGAWRVGTRGAFAPGTGSYAWPRLLAVGALLGSGRFGISVRPRGWRLRASVGPRVQSVGLDSLCPHAPLLGTRPSVYTRRRFSGFHLCFNFSVCACTCFSWLSAKQGCKACSLGFGWCIGQQLWGLGQTLPPLCSSGSIF